MKLKLKERAPINLTEKHRPRSWDQVVGQATVITSITRAIELGTLPRGFLLSGPSGAGKTTIAHLIANGLGVTRMGLITPAAGTYSGAREMRELIELSSTAPLDGSPAKLLLLDECQSVTRGAWDCLLEPLERGRSHAFFALCTTEPESIPRTVLTRVFHYKLGEIPTKSIVRQLRRIADAERLDVSDRSIDVAARRAAGSMRAAINYLAMSLGLQDEPATAWPL